MPVTPFLPFLVDSFLLAFRELRRLVGVGEGDGRLLLLVHLDGGLSNLEEVIEVGVALVFDEDGLHGVSIIEVVLHRFPL
jgi:hypothetical protein